MNTQGKKVLVMPGVASQVPLLKKLRAMGCRNFVINPSEGSPAYEFAEKHCKANFFDYPACRRFADEIKPDAVLSDQCDAATKPVSDMAAYLGLRGIDPKVVPLFRDKSKMRQFTLLHNLNPVESRRCETLDEALRFYKKLGTRMIIKPLDSNSSRGVYTIDSESALEAHFELSLRQSLSEKGVICERYISGTEFTIDGIKIPGEKHRCLAISEKRHFVHNPNIACELYFSHHNENFDYGVLQELNNRYVELSGLEFGLTHAEYKYENGRFYLIEIGARGGGGYISSHIVPCMSGVDSVGILIRMSLGEKIDASEIVIPDKLRNRCAVLKFFDFPAGCVRAIRGEDFLMKNPHVLDYRFNFKCGDAIVKPVDDSKRVGYYIAYEDTTADLNRLMNEISEKVSLEF